MEFTVTQKQACGLEGDSLLVSAAAGSGKTAVLASRVVRKLKDEQNPCPASSLMVLTFTNAAAEQMRRRITKQLREALSDDPQNGYLRRQLALLPSAKICTIHSACLDLVRSNFEKLELDPRFTVAEPAQLELMRAELLDDFIEKLYERAGTEQSVAGVIDVFTRGRDDVPLVRAVESCCGFLQNEPYPERFIRFACRMPAENVFDSLPDDYIFTVLSSEFESISRSYDTLIRSAGEAGFEKLCAFYDGEREALQKTVSCISDRYFDGAVVCAREVVFKNHPSRPKDCDEIVWNRLKDDRTELKERFLSLRDSFLYDDSESVLHDRKAELETIGKLLTLCQEFNDLFLAERRRGRLVSFDDAEKYALSLLVCEDEGDMLRPTPLALELRENYSEIIVDEFQDCSKIQNLIFNALSRDGKNLFAVGDVKQSIYRFRNAYPQLFIQKQQSSAYPDGDRLCRPSKLDLNSNFRSHPKILEFVNRVFDPLMTLSRGGIDYMSGHRLANGGLYDGTDAASVNLSLLVSAGEERYSAKSMLEAEAHFVAGKIKSIAGKLKIYDIKSQSERTVELSDIAILMRAPKTGGAVFEKVLESEGVGCINNNPSEKYLDTPEVRDVLAYLQTIDNPYNDIPLITLMYSEYFGFTVNELGDIRAKYKGMLFFDAVKLYAKSDAKTRAFVDTIESLRALSALSDVYTLINRIYEQSGVLIYSGNDEGAESARANLMLLLDFAVQFESTRYRGLFAFINYILKLIEKDQTIPAARLRRNAGCVSLLSIHGSKGLEFPVVFLVTCGNDIRCEINSEILLEDTLGAGGFVRDGVRHREFSSLYRNALKLKMTRDGYNEYIRLLYVALTRACSHLFITAAMTGDNACKAILRACERSGAPSDYDVYGSPSFFKWILGSVINSKSAAPLRAFAGAEPGGTEDGLFFTEISRLYQNDDMPDTLTFARTDRNFERDDVERMICRRYAYEAETQIPAKLSVSQIKRANDTKPVFALTPRFMQNGRTGADRGNATHAFLQYCNFESIKDAPSLEREISRLYADEFITKTQTELIEREKILRFLQSDLMKELSASGTCKKEQRFLFTLPARQVTDVDSDEPVIVQGIVDCWYKLEGGAVIIDYKTDRVKSPAELAGRYATQLQMYELALDRLEGIKTLHRYIYSFCLDMFIEV